VIVSISAAPVPAEVGAQTQERQMRAMELRLADLERRLKEAEARRSPPDPPAAATAGRIARLEAQIRALAKDNADVKARVRDHQRQIAGAATSAVPTLEKQIAALKKQVDALGQHVSAADKDAKHLRKQFEGHTHRIPIALMPHKMLFANPNHASTAFVGTIAFGGPGVGSGTSTPQFLP
jgi:chromosome segregation ATPase